MSISHRLHSIRCRYVQYAKGFNHPYSPMELSDAGHLCLVDVPFLLGLAENQTYQDGKYADPNSNPASHGIGLSESAAKLVHSKEPAVCSLFPSASPFAEFLKGFLPQFVWVLIGFHAGHFLASRITKSTQEAQS